MEEKPAVAFASVFSKLWKFSGPGEEQAECNTEECLDLFSLLMSIIITTIIIYISYIYSI